MTEINSIKVNPFWFNRFGFLLIKEFLFLLVIATVGNSPFYNDL
jgi:hypothetical protein